jgi:hypothetical protein
MQPDIPAKNLLSPDQLSSLGEVAAESAALEEVVQATLMYILQLDATAAHAQFGNFGLTRKVLKLKELGLNMLQDTMAKDDFNALLRLIELRVGSRNTVIHGSWTPDEKLVKFEHAMDMTYGTRPPEGVVATNPKFGNRYAAEQLKGLAQGLFETRHQLWAFGVKHWWKAWTRQVVAKVGVDAAMTVQHKKP